MFKTWLTHPIILAILLGISIFMVGLDRAPVPTIDGAVRAVEARTMVETGVWFPVQYQGQKFLDHPPLFLWITAVSFKVFGTNDFAANLPARLAAIGILIFLVLIQLELNLNFATVILSLLILATTRDFILSSVRGYIEPIFTFFSMAGSYFTLRASLKKQTLISSIIAGVSIFLVFFSKGPPAILPLMICVLIPLFYFKTLNVSKYVNIYVGFGLGFLSLVAIFIYKTTLNQEWLYWDQYLKTQILSSALKGREGAQAQNYFFYFYILFNYYIPWNVFLLGSLVFAVINRKWQSLLIFTFGFGFVLGFSIPVWKFWYYIAPAYPPFAIFIATICGENIKIQNLIEKTAPLFCALCICWIVIGTTLPIKLHKERALEVIEFKELILSSNPASQVYMLHAGLDHNLIGTSGEWYFKRQVIRIDNSNSLELELSKTKIPAWIITSDNELNNCLKKNAFNWCRSSKVLKKTARSILILTSS